MLLNSSMRRIRGLFTIRKNKRKTKPLTSFIMTWDAYKESAILILFTQPLRLGRIWHKNLQFWSYLPNPSARAGYDTRTCNFDAKCKGPNVEGPNQNTKQDLLKLKNLRLQKKSVNICRAGEKDSIHGQRMELEEAQVRKIDEANRAQEQDGKKEGLFCGYLHEPKHSRCPAYGKNIQCMQKEGPLELKCPKKVRKAPKQRSNISKKCKCNALQPHVHHL